MKLMASEAAPALLQNPTTAFPSSASCDSKLPGRGCLIGERAVAFHSFPDMLAVNSPLGSVARVFQPSVMRGYYDFFCNEINKI